MKDDKDSLIPYRWMMRAKHLGVITGLAALLCYALYVKMEVLSLCSTVLLLCCIYKDKSELVFRRLLFLVQQANKAKFGKLEVDLAASTVVKVRGEHPAWAHIILSQLQPEHIGLLMLIGRVEDFEVHDANRGLVRGYRSHGLVAHDGGSITKATVAWLTPLGRELYNILDSQQGTLPILEKQDRGRRRGKIDLESTDS